MTEFKTSDFTYRPESRTFVAEASDLGLDRIPTACRIVNPATGGARDFSFSHADTDGEDTYGWNFRSADGIKALIIND